MDTKNRINIDGVWYVREGKLNSTDINFQVYEDDHIPTRGITLELEDFCFEFSVLEDIPKEAGQPSTFYGHSIVFYDKNTDIRHEDWDNDTWMKGVFKGDKESMEDLPNEFSKTQLVGLRAIIQRAIELGYINK